MNKYYATAEDSSIIFEGNVEILREFLEEELEKKLGFYPALQENTDEGYLEVYLHTEANEDLLEEQMKKLNFLGIKEDNSLSEIMSFLNISQIENWVDNEIVSCSKCSKKYHETQLRCCLLL